MWLTLSFFVPMQIKTFKHFFEYGTVKDTVIKSVLVTFVQESINASILIPDYSAILLVGCCNVKLPLNFVCANKVKQHFVEQWLM